MEIIQRESTLEALRSSNREIEELLDQLRIPIIDALTKERPLYIEFTELIHEKVIILMPQEHSKLELDLNLPNLMIEEYLFSRIATQSRKKKAQEITGTSNLYGKGKEVLLETPTPSSK